VQYIPYVAQCVVELEHSLTAYHFAALFFR
jgi:hypothetical protein